MNFDSFELAVYVNVPSSSLYNCWICSGLLEEWFLKKATFIEPVDLARQPDEPCKTGDSYWWEWSDGTTEVGEVLEVTENAFSFTFGTGVVVKVEFEGGDRSLVVLNQRHSMEDETQKQRTYVSCLQGWTFFLTNLKSFLEGGVDLREHEPDRAFLVNH
jgi:uncharacterized protein YndB with AHSA1/START domain